MLSSGAASGSPTLVDGFSLHAGVHLHANDREGLEKLCGYIVPKLITG